MAVPDATLAAAAMAAVVADGNVLQRRASWQDPPFWCRPIVAQAGRPVQALSDWQTVVSVEGTPGQVAVIREWVGTSVGAQTFAELEFRILQGGAVMNVTAPDGCELCKLGPNTYPVVRRPVFLISKPSSNQLIELQVRSFCAFQMTALCGLYGWFYPNPDAENFSVWEGIADAQ